MIHSTDWRKLTERLFGILIDERKGRLRASLFFIAILSRVGNSAFSDIMIVARFLVIYNVYNASKSIIHVTYQGQNKLPLFQIHVHHSFAAFIDAVIDYVECDFVDESFKELILRFHIDFGIVDAID